MRCLTFDLTDAEVTRVRRWFVADPVDPEAARLYLYGVLSICWIFYHPCGFMETHATPTSFDRPVRDM